MLSQGLREMYKQMRKCTPGVPRKPEKLIGKAVSFSIENSKGYNEDYDGFYGGIVKVFCIEISTIYIYITVSDVFKKFLRLTWSEDSGWRLDALLPAVDYVEIMEIKFV